MTQPPMRPPMWSWVHRLPWFLRALWQPDVELDLLDASGAPDHGKVIGAFAFFCDILLIVSGYTPPLGHFIALNSVVFGWIGWRTFLKSRTVTATGTDDRETIAESRTESRHEVIEYHVTEHEDPETLADREHEILTDAPADRVLDTGTR